MATEWERSFIDRMGLPFHRAGTSQTAGRLLAWLMICDPPEQSLTQLAEALEVSKASVSTTARQLEAGGMLERVPVRGDRSHHYRLKGGDWTSLLFGRMGIVDDYVEVAEFGLSKLGDGARSERLAQFRDFMEFVEEEFGEEMIRRWEAFRERRRKG